MTKPRTFKPPSSASLYVAIDDAASLVRRIVEDALADHLCLSVQSRKAIGREVKLKFETGVTPIPVSAPKPKTETGDKE